LGPLFIWTQCIHSTAADMRSGRVLRARTSSRRVAAFATDCWPEFIPD